VDDHRVTRLQGKALSLQRLLQVLRGDLVVVRQHVDALRPATSISTTDWSVLRGADRRPAAGGVNV
jgi:hypothetical protein